MKTGKLPLTLILLSLCGCASFNSGDLKASRRDLRRMLDARDVPAAAEIRVTWENFPYKSAIETIGEGQVQPPPPKPVPAPGEDTGWLRRKAEDVFGEAGLYDAVKGSGTITVTLTSYGRWTYGKLFKTFLVDTGFIFLIPATLRANYQLRTDYDGPAGRFSAEETGYNKTTFHALLFPLYPFASPSAKEHSLLKKLLWKSAVDVYTKAARSGPPAAAGQ